MSDSQIHSSTREFHGRQVHSVSTEIAGRTLTLETGRLAEQAGGGAYWHMSAARIANAIVR